jgi:hypothetical protein
LVGFGLGGIAFVFAVFGKIGAQVLEKRLDQKELT